MRDPDVSCRRVIVFDTTLRDGEQAPGCSMNLPEKLAVAGQLERLGVDVIEAGFAAASPGDAAAIKAVAKAVRAPAVASLARALEKDIDAAWEAVREAQRPRIHTFIATSPIHMEYKLKMGPDAVVERAASAVRYARSLCPDVEFSAEDASRSDPDFLCRVFSAAVEAGATTLNVPDTVGYAVPGEFAELVRRLRAGIRGVERAVLSVHCHNDLGLAVANSLAAIEAGAEQVECTVNGIGERAGNAALEELAMALRTRGNRLGACCGIDTTQIYPASRLVAASTGSKVQANKAIVGENAFAHEAGIHQHGILANRETYEIMTPESVGLPRNRMVLGKHSGRHAFDERVAELGLALGPEDAARIFEQFKELADKKKTVSDRDIEALVRGSARRLPESFRLERFVINSGSSITATSAVCLALRDGTREERVAVGDGPIDASFKAIDKIVGKRLVLEDFSLESVTGGKDAQGEAHVRIALDGRRYNGRGLSTDIVEASVRAYLAAINSMEAEAGGGDGTGRAS
ncbi:MAG TPA: 2-isopropylmalate synthase [Spirochaetales bacterium]|nr:2-isopropylmalate synthase [Spirochaetales bacterium]HRY55317.1 2-isopropylmalate synthase [Spirochaetia bacterium]HRZ64328.1 2-isopropylmalate synthase [Spirochaetia bacterium]